MMVLVEPSSFGELGLLPIHIACLQGDIRALLQLLNSNNAIDTTKTVDARTARGETPLMLAALMGNVEGVVILRQHHAAIESVDSFGMNALAHTTDNVFNDMRRKAYYKHGFTQTEGAKYRCIAIATLLSPSTILKAPRSYTGVPTGPIYFRKTSNSIQAFHSIDYIRTPGYDPRPKTIGFIRAATDLTPRAWVASGWSKRTTPSKLLEGYKYTKVALRRVAPAIGFVFEAHINDQGFKSGTIPINKQGSFFASHAEVKLAVWYCFSILAAMKSISHPSPSMTFLAQHLSDLATADLGDGRRAVIEIDQPPCESCARFLKALTGVTKIDFEPLYRRTLALVPEAIKRRAGRLAHEVDWTEPEDKDDGSDTDGEWDTDNDENDRLADYEGWQSDGESETIPDGLEDYEPEAFKKVQHTNSSQRTPQKTSDNPSDFDHSSQQISSISRVENNHNIGTSLGSSDNWRIEEPPSPTEMMLSTRNRGSKSKRHKRSPYYIKKRGQVELRSWREEIMKIKREEDSLAANERPRTPENSDTINSQGGIKTVSDPNGERPVVLRSTSIRPATQDPSHVSPIRITRQAVPASAAATERIRSFAYGHDLTHHDSHSQAFFSPTDTPQTVIPAWRRLQLDLDLDLSSNDD